MIYIIESMLNDRRLPDFQFEAVNDTDAKSKFREYIDNIKAHNKDNMDYLSYTFVLKDANRKEVQGFGVSSFLFPYTENSKRTLAIQ